MVKPFHCKIMKKIFVVLAILALGLTACNTDIEQPVETPVIEKGSAVYQVRIPASMGAETKAVAFDGTNAAVSTFAAGDKVYIYNETKGAMACDDQGNAIALTLTAGDITNDGKNCTLRGNLTFYKYENSTWNAVAVDGSDSYKLLYNLSDPDKYEPIYSCFWYIEQDGTAAGIADYAIATTTLTEDVGQLTPTSTVSFTNVQSMFRFQFINEASNPINVKHLVITSKNWAIAQGYYPFSPYYTCDFIPVTLTTPTTDYIYVALCINESIAAGDELSFTAVDADGKVYTGTKAAPASGFVNGKYYYNSSAIPLTHDASQDRIRPTIVWTNPSTPVEPDYGGIYNLSTADFDITLSGTSRNCFFDNTNSGTVRLNGIDATNYGQFLSSGDNLTVELLNGSANTIVSTNTNGTRCIGANTLKLCGNGTLTVTAKSAADCGIRGTTNYSTSNNDNATTTERDVTTQLAADGFIVTRSARTDNADGTYTWTYTVTPCTAVNIYTAVKDREGNYVAHHGDVISGWFYNNNKKIIIPDGATVILKDFDGASYDNFVVCQGNATVLLSGTNYLNSTSDYSALSCPSGKTLTIGGTGSLEAISSYAAGIGGGRYSGYQCGNIVITGGTITAYGGNGAGIGGGQTDAPCGNITINGGTIRAYGSRNCPGIGAGYNCSTCGSITINSGVQSITVQNDYYSADTYFIGGSKLATCGTVTIDGTTTFTFTTSTTQFKHFNSTLSADGNTWTLTKKP